MAEMPPDKRLAVRGLALDASGSLVLALVISMALLAALALSLVWLNIERTKLAYRVRALQKEVAQVTDLNAKLGIEREHLLSPVELGKKAERLGLRPAKPGQIRRLRDVPGQDVPGQDVPGDKMQGQGIPGPDSSGP